jgi:hypothetical protein
MNTKMRFEMWSSLNNIPAIVEFISEKPGFIMASDQMISILSCAPIVAESPTAELFDRLKDLKTRYLRAWIPNTIAPKEMAFQDARGFILSLPLMQIVRPSINIAGDGEVNFEWKGPDYHIDLGFYGDQTFSYYATKNGQKPLFGDEIPIKNGIPKELIDFASVV